MKDFKPWATPCGRSPQQEALDAISDYRTVVYRTGNRCGKDVLGAAAIARLAATCNGRPRRMRIETEGLDIIASTVWPALRQALDNFNGWRCLVAYEGVPVAFDFMCGCKLTMGGASFGLDENKSFDFVWLNEIAESYDIDEALTDIGGTGGRLLVTLTPVGPSDSFARLQQIEREPTTRVVRASMTDMVAAGVLHDQATTEYLASLSEPERSLRNRGDYRA